MLYYIVTEKKFSSAMENIKNSLSPGGTFIVVPILNESKRSLFYSRYWSFKDIKKRFIGYNFKECVEIPDSFFKGSHALLIKDPHI